MGLLVAIGLGFLSRDGFQTFFFGYLTALGYFMAIALGALFFVLIHHLTRAGWSVNIRRVAENMAAMLPVHDVSLACQELQRCVKDYDAVGAFVRPNYLNGRYWHSNYWDPLYGLLQDLNVPLCFHEGTGSYYSTIEPRFGENRFMRHVASHSTEMQLALIALMLGGIFEFYPKLRVAFLEAQSWWVPGLLGRIEWDLRQHHDSDAPYLKLSPFEYFQRNCFSAIESGEKEVGSVVELLGGADNIVVNNLSATDVKEVAIDLAATIGSGIGDGQADSVTVNATNSSDTISIAGSGGSVRGSRRGEMIARCVVESGTSSLYSAIRDASEEPVLKEIAGRIAADEYRHYKLFYEILHQQNEPDMSFWRKLWVAISRVRAPWVSFRHFSSSPMSLLA